MQQLIALVGLPLALLVTTTGLGLLAERAAGARLCNGLLAPLGFCVATSVLLFAFELGAGLTVAVALLVAGTVAGFALARSHLRERVNPGWPALAGLAVYALYAAPVLLTGDWTWSGYNFLNDTSVQFLLIDHLKGASADLSALPLSTGRQFTAAYLENGLSDGDARLRCRLGRPGRQRPGGRLRAVHRRHGRPRRDGAVGPRRANPVRTDHGGAGRRVRDVVEPHVQHRPAGQHQGDRRHRGARRGGGARARGRRRA